MWLSVIVVDLTTPAPESTLVAIQAKKDEMRSREGAGGNSIEGFELPVDFSEITTDSITVKRQWATQELAQEFVDFINTYSPGFIGTVEEVA